MAIAFFGSLFARMTAAAPGTGNTDHVLTRPLVVVGVKVVCTVADAGAIAQVFRSTAALPAVFNAVTNAMACAVLDAATEATTLAQAQTTFATGDTMRFALTLGVATVNGVALIQCYGGVIPGGT